MERIFEPLEPPPGGLNALRARLDARERRQHRRRLLLTGAALGTAAALALLMVRPALPPVPPVQVSNAATMPVPTDSETVIFVLVGR